MALEEEQPLFIRRQSHSTERTGDESEDHVPHETGIAASEKVLEKALVKKLDKRMSILILIHILNFIDRNNVAAARLRGFEKDLNLEGNQFAMVLSVMYIGYIIMQIPSNMMLNHIGKPSLYLPACMMIWGAISFCTGFVNSFTAVLCARFALGFAEAAFFPGALFLISKWYKRNELSFRLALLICGSIISNAFGSLIASAILSLVDNWLGYAAWRWLFFVEGGLTITVAFIAMFVLPDFPETTVGWLSLSERHLAQRRMCLDTGLDPDRKAASELGNGFLLAMSDRKVWWLALTFVTMVAALSFNAYFPTLTATMGYNPTVTLLLCAPPWFFASLSALLVSIHSDRMQERFWHIVLPLSVGCLGFIIAMSTMNTAMRYISLFLMAQIYSGFVCFLAWMSGSIPHPPSKRAVALAFINCFSQLGNVAAMYAWPRSWGPTYRTSYALCLGSTVTCIVMCYIFRKELMMLNRKASSATANEGNRTFRYLL
ncbi:hypothetical protein M378DRAFT_156155 [Amanita muscaria Koide BX008]|uniref:Major facilitator superfamily (MFS) profile domain-containing protein n=1 Tax=Amanita muscaria (strain Koide BX008) TaxID=946122 RepID=A0A0C2T2N5_AMAMK|nr:hypothetical protein M378DRAFT_156155 [Amanita muscaria Koide BX008]